MFREIKFRALSEEKKEFVYGHFSIERYCSMGTDFTIKPTVGISIRINRNTLSQFTGLYDKNGKEIFEGDIVKHFNHNEIIREIIFMKGSFGYWAGEEFISYASNYRFEWENSNKSEKIEIIGNIYENPELLKSGGEK